MNADEYALQGLYLGQRTCVVWLRGLEEVRTEKYIL